jgi:HEAT repeat protein
MSGHPLPPQPPAPEPRGRKSRIGTWVIGLSAVALGLFLSRPGNKARVEKTAPQVVPQTVDTANVAEKSAKMEPATGVTSFADTNSSEAQLVSQLLNASLPLKARRQAARALAKTGSDNSISALKTALREGPPSLKSAIGEALGESPHPEARGLLIDLINGTDAVAARGAIRGMAARGDAEATDILSNILFNDKKSASLRTEAALALGDVQQPMALSALVRATAEIQDPDILEQVLEGLGRKPFAETEKFFHDYLESPGLTTESKVAALEALGNTTGDISTLALKYATDPDPEVRAAAAWALSATETQVNVAPQLLDLLKTETAPEVRGRLYEALGGQDNVDAGAVLAMVQKETDVTARQAGLGILAELCRSTTTPGLLEFFKQTAVPELENRALASTDLQERFNSIMSLRRAGLPESLAALQDIAQKSTDPKIIEAAQAGLRANLKK